MSSIMSKYTLLLCGEIILSTDTLHGENLSNLKYIMKREFPMAIWMETSSLFFKIKEEEEENRIFFCKFFSENRFYVYLIC